MIDTASTSRAAIEHDLVAGAPLVLALLEGLERAQLPYCLWKSTSRMDEVLAGTTDFDILVDDGARERWEDLITSLGFKPFISHASRQYPGIEDRIGYDEALARLVHLHVHYRLILGQQYVKNHHLPIEQSILSATRLRRGVRIPPPEVELAILTVRALLKYRDVDALKDALSLGQRGGLPPDILAEVEDLTARFDPGSLAPTLARIAPMIPADLVLDFVETVRVARRDAGSLLNLRRRVRRAMRPYQRMSSRRATWRYLRARLARQWPVSILSKSESRRQARRKSPGSGGTTIAIIGADGSGKTTMVDHVMDWLAARVRIRTYYLGSARPSRSTDVARHGTKMAKRLHAGSRRLLGGRHPVTRLVADVTDTMAAVRAVGDARDRLERYRAGTQAAGAGSVVIFDRFPIAGVQLDDRYVDGPRIVRASNPLARRLARRERLLHRCLGTPDHVAALVVSPEVAIERKAPRDEAALVAKCRAVAEWEPVARLDVERIDADRSLPEVQAQIRRQIWRWL